MTSEEEVRGVCVCVRCLCGYNRFDIMQWVFTCLNVLWVWALHNDNDGEVDGGQTERESGCESENIRSGSHFCSQGSDLVIGLQLVKGFPQSLIKPSYLFYTHTRADAAAPSVILQSSVTLKWNRPLVFVLIRRLQEAAEVKSVCTWWSEAARLCFVAALQS